MSRLVGQAVPRFSNVHGAFDAAREAALEVRARLEQAGVRVPKTGRLNEYIRQLTLAQDVVNGGASSRFDLYRLHRAAAEIDELSLILTQLSAEPAVPGWMQKARLAMKGAYRPGEEQSNSGAWDNQFELYVAAVCRRAGYAVALEEPDVVIQTDSGSVGIAAKRPRSAANFATIIDRADRQIRESGKLGLIALDVSYLTNPTDGFVPCFDDRDGLAHIRATVDAFLERNHELMLGRVDRQKTIGVIVYASLLGVNSSPPHLSVIRGSAFGNFCSRKDSRLQLITQIRRRVTFNA